MAAAGPEVRALFGDLAVPGHRLQRWSVVAVHDVTLGAIPVVLAAADGERFQVDVLRRDPSSPASLEGIGRSASLSVFLANQGNGSAPTVEERGLAAMALADALGAREGAGAPIPSALLTLRDRRRRHPNGVYDGLYGVPT